MSIFFLTILVLKYNKITLTQYKQNLFIIDTSQLAELSISKIFLNTQNHFFQIKNISIFKKPYVNLCKEFN